MCMAQIMHDLGSTGWPPCQLADRTFVMRRLNLIAGATIAALIGVFGTGPAHADTFNFSDFPGTAPSTANNDNGAVGNIDTFSSVNTTNNTVNSDGLAISAGLPDDRSEERRV